MENSQLPGLYAVTHPGQAHRDEFIACSLLLAAKKVVQIFRREPTVEEMENPNVYVVDIGGKHEPHKNNFDHHQLPRDADPTCSASMVMDCLGIRDTEIFNWIETTDKIDSRGPFFVAKEAGVSADALFSLMSPIEAQILQLFGKETGRGGVTDPLITIMEGVGLGWLDYYSQIKERMNFLAEHGRLTFFDGVMAFINPAKRNENPALAVDMYLKKYHPFVAVVVSEDDRGDGFSLYRRNDDPRVDFSKIKDHPDVTFAHPGGFIAKTVEDAPIKELVGMSLLPGEELT